MKKLWNKLRAQSASMQLLFSYLMIILAPAAAIVVIFMSMQRALLDIQKEKAVNLSKEAVMTFNKEIERADNIVKYIRDDSKLRDYLNQRNSFSSQENYYKAYELAKSYPDYAILNNFVKNIYIFSKDNPYLIRMPQVIPNNEHGKATLNAANFSEQFQELVENQSDQIPDGLIQDTRKDGTSEFLVVQSFSFSKEENEKGTIVIELDRSQIQSLLGSSLRLDEGMAFLIDSKGKILTYYNNMDGISVPKTIGMSWQNYISSLGWKEKNMNVCTMTTKYNQWSIVTLIPHQVLLAKISGMQYMILLFCVISILIGIALSLWQWNNSRPVIKQYLKFSERYDIDKADQHQNKRFWRNFGIVFERIEVLQSTVEKQKQLVLDGIIRKILFGNYDSEEEVRKELEQAELDFPVSMPCFVAVIDMESAIMRQEWEDSVEALEKIWKESLEIQFQSEYWMMSIGQLNYVLLIPYKKELGSEEAKIKQLFEKMNYSIYSQIPVNIYTGLSGKAESLTSIAEEYEQVKRICEYAKYYKLRVPLLQNDLPVHQHVVFPVEMELQLEKAIKKGTREQLQKLLEQVKDYHMRISGGFQPMHHILEILRCVVFRCLDQETESQEKEGLLEEVKNAKTMYDMEQTILKAWQYFDRPASTDDIAYFHLKKSIENKIQEEYFRKDLNLTMIADWIKMPEKKLYHEFKKMYGVSFCSYLEMLRIQNAQELLKAGQPVQEAADLTGYSSDYSFRRAFKRVVGVTPSDYQKIERPDG